MKAEVDKTTMLKQFLGGFYQPGDAGKLIGDILMVYLFSHEKVVEAYDG